MNQLSENEIDFMLKKVKEKEARGEFIPEGVKTQLEIMKMHYEAAHAQSHNKYEIADPLMALLKERLKDNKFIKLIEHKIANIIINTTISDIILSILISDYYLLDKLKYDEKRLIHEMKICSKNSKLVNKIVKKTGLRCDGDYTENDFYVNGIIYPTTKDIDGVIEMIQLTLNSANFFVNEKPIESKKLVENEILKESPTAIIDIATPKRKIKRNKNRRMRRKLAKAYRKKH